MGADRCDDISFTKLVCQVHNSKLIKQEGKHLMNEIFLEPVKNWNLLNPFFLTNRSKACTELFFIKITFSAGHLFDLFVAVMHADPFILQQACVLWKFDVAEV